MFRHGNGLRFRCRCCDRQGSDTTGGHVTSRPVKGFATIAIPAIVELSTGKTHQYEGKLILGAI
jgi:hypothetical protein